MRAAPSLDIVPALIGAGAKVRAYDPEGMQQAAPLLPGVCWCKNAYEAITGADAVAILTEWNEFRGLRSEEHTSELQSLMRISYAVFCLKKTNKHNNQSTTL